jgi:hypothetical protein
MFRRLDVSGQLLVFNYQDRIMVVESYCTYPETGEQVRLSGNASAQPCQRV